jgi:acetyltransferase-like isoleucine patch superfamily enzyme
MLDAIKRLIFRVLRWACTTYARRKVARYGVGLTVNFPCMFTTNTEIGNYCHFNGMKVRGTGRLTVGNYFHSGEEIFILTQNHNYRDPQCLPYDHVDIPRDVTIGDYVWLGSRVTILPGVVLGDGCIVQAGAVVSGKFPPNAILGGNPAVIIRYRDEAAVARLVSQGRFLL